MTDNLFKKIGAAQKAVEEAKNAVDYFSFQSGKLSSRDARFLTKLMAKVQEDGGKAEVKLFRMIPKVRIARRDGKAVFIEN